MDRTIPPSFVEIGPKLAFLFIAGSFGALLVGWLVVVARAVSRKTPIFFIGRQNVVRYFGRFFFEKTADSH